MTTIHNRKNHMKIRQAFPNEVDKVMLIIEDARKQLAISGSNQWQGDYPNRQTIFEDILTGKGYVALQNNQLVAYVAVITDGEPAYHNIYDGKWKHNHSRYVVFHRVAVLSSVTGQKIAQTFLQGLIEGIDSHDFRCDTHEKNKTMQHILEKLGYVYCGKVPIDGERLAYQKIKTKAENALRQEIDEATHYNE